MGATIAVCGEDCSTGFVVSFVELLLSDEEDGIVKCLLVLSGLLKSEFDVLLRFDAAFAAISCGCSLVRVGDADENPVSASVCACADSRAPNMEALPVGEYMETGPAEDEQWLFCCALLLPYKELAWIQLAWLGGFTMELFSENDHGWRFE